MRKWEWSQSVHERAKFYAEWNNYFCAAHKGDFSYKLLTRKYIFQLTKYEHKGVSKSNDFDDTNFSSAGIAE